MLELIQTFINSQIFAVIVTVVLTFLSTLVIDKLKFSRDEKIYLKRKRECLYQKMYDFSMRLEKDIRDKNKAVMSKATKDLWNDIQVESIFGKQDTMEAFYDLYEDLEASLDSENNGWLEIHKQNNTRILEFYVLIKQELGIAD